MNEYDHWLERWEVEADRLFRAFESLPSDLQMEAAQLRAWGREAQEVIAKIQHIRLQLRHRRLARQQAETEVAAIVERQRLATELELAQREYLKWQRQFSRLKKEIDRITDKIILAMRQRKRAEVEQHAQADAAARQQALEDLQFWEAFTTHLNAETPEAATQQTLQSNPLQAQEERARLRQEYQAYRARPIPRADEDEAAWSEFLASLTPRKKPRS